MVEKAVIVTGSPDRCFPLLRLACATSSSQRERQTIPFNGLTQRHQACFNDVAAALIKGNKNSRNEAAIQQSPYPKNNHTNGHAAGIRMPKQYPIYIKQTIQQHKRKGISMSPKTNLSLAIAALFATLLSGCSSMQLGSQDAKTAATGSAGGANTQNANSTLEKCAVPLGTMAVVEDTQAPWYGILTGQMKLGATTPVLKLLVQQSNCFVVVDRGRAMNNMMQERSLQQSGELRQKSNFGKGKMVAADYSLSPSITFSNNNAGGMGAGLAGISGSLGILGAIAGSMQTKEASTLLTVVENRSGVQVAVAEGSARNMDFGGIGALFGGGLGGGLGGYSNTAEGKVIVAAFTDAYNNVVKAVRNYKQQLVEGGLGTGGKLGVQSDDSQPTAKRGTKKKTRKVAKADED